MSQARHIAYIDGITDVSPQDPLDDKMRETIVGYAWAGNAEKLKPFIEAHGENIQRELTKGWALAAAKEAGRRYGAFPAVVANPEDVGEEPVRSFVYGEY